MDPREAEGIAAALGSTVVATRTLVGGFSHGTCLLTLPDGQVVVRLGGPDPAIEAAVMHAARRYVPVPQVLLVIPQMNAVVPQRESGPPCAGAGVSQAAVGLSHAEAGVLQAAVGLSHAEAGVLQAERAVSRGDGGGGRSAMVVEYVSGTLLSDVLAGTGFGDGAWGDLGAEVGRVVAAVGAVTFDRPGFFVDEGLTVRLERPWSQQLPEFAMACMGATPPPRLDPGTQQAWVELCAAHAPALIGVDDQARLVHADVNPKNILVTRTGGSWRVDALLDWEFSFSGCVYGDAANMSRFGDDYPARFVDGFRTSFFEHLPDDLRVHDDWDYLGRVLDMFALNDLVTRPIGHPVADQAAQRIRRWVSQGVPGRG